MVCATLQLCQLKQQLQLAAYDAAPAAELGKGSIKGSEEDLQSSLCEQTQGLQCASAQIQHAVGQLCQLEDTRDNCLEDDSLAYSPREYAGARNAGQHNAHELSREDSTGSGTSAFSLDHLASSWDAIMRSSRASALPAEQLQSAGPLHQASEDLKYQLAMLEAEPYCAVQDAIQESDSGAWPE